MVNTLKEIANRVFKTAEIKWGWVLEAIDEQLRHHDTVNKEFEDDAVHFQEEAMESDAVSGKKHPLIKLYGQSEGYMPQVSVLGFNSAKYNLNLIKRCIAKQLDLHDPDRKARLSSKNVALTPVLRPTS